MVYYMVYTIYIAYYIIYTIYMVYCIVYTIYMVNNMVYTLNMVYYIILIISARSYTACALDPSVDGLICPFIKIKKNVIQKNNIKCKITKKISSF